VLWQVIRVLIAIGIGWAVFRVGLGILRSFAQPVPGPPPPGEMRKVDLRYRCSLCGAEIRMTLASEELPEPPRHCQEDMDLVAPVE
jgi:hypothetical protein